MPVLEHFHAWRLAARDPRGYGVPCVVAVTNRLVDVDHVAGLLPLFAGVVPQDG
jgi:hypothetical protein